MWQCPHHWRFSRCNWTEFQIISSRVPFPQEVGPHDFSRSLPTWPILQFYNSMKNIFHFVNLHLQSYLLLLYNHQSAEMSEELQASTGCRKPLFAKRNRLALQAKDVPVQNRLTYQGRHGKNLHIFFLEKILKCFSLTNYGGKPLCFS